MLFAPNRDAVPDRIDNELRWAPSLTSALFSSIIANTCQRLPLLRSAGKTAQLDRLIETGAWIDASLVLIELELPAWKVRRLAYDDGEWICSLSNQPNVPAQFDDTADAHHEVLALAILSAFVEARRRTFERKISLTSVPSAKSAAAAAICCDNFA